MRAARVSCPEIMSEAYQSPPNTLPAVILLQAILTT